MALLSRWQGTDPPPRPLLPLLLPLGARLPSYTTKATGNRPEASGRAGAGWSGSSPSQGTSHQNRIPYKPVITAITLMIREPWPRGGSDVLPRGTVCRQPRVPSGATGRPCLLGREGLSEQLRVGPEGLGEPPGPGHARGHRARSPVHAVPLQGVSGNKSSPFPLPL